MTDTMDFIQIEEDEFLKHRQSMVEDKDMSSKIEGLLGKFTCFQDYSAFTSYAKTKRSPNQNAVHTPHGHGHGNGHGSGHHHANARVNHTVPHYRKQIKDPSQTGLDREITGWLNKISKRNFVKISSQILRFVNPKTVKVITNSVLEKCQKQPVFLDLYIGVLNELLSKSNQECKTQIREILSDYIQDFIAKRQFKNFHLDSLSYSE